MRLLLALLALLVIWAEPLHVHGLGEAEARYQQGDFLVAAELGRTLASTDGDTLAARATLVEAAFRAQKNDKSRLFELAAANARRALARDPEHVDAHLQLALALGHLGELNGPIEAHLQGMRAKSGAISIARWSWTRTTPGPTARWGCGTSRSCATQALRSPANSTVRRPRKASRTASARSSWRPRASGCASAAASRCWRSVAAPTADRRRNSFVRRCACRRAARAAASATAARQGWRFSD